MARIVNGRLVDPPASGLSGQDLLDAMRPDAGRRVVMGSGIQYETVRPDTHYPPSKLVDRKGTPVMIKEMPDRTKGQSIQSYGGTRSSVSKQIIFEQVQSVSEGFYKDKPIDFDSDNGNWIVFEGFLLPPRWRAIAHSSPLLISFPMEYPNLPPVGFYLRASLPQSPNGHLYQAAYHSADKEPIGKNWLWYCVYIGPSGWRPAPYRRAGDWRRGDSLWEYLTLINEALQSSD